MFYLISSLRIFPFLILIATIVLLCAEAFLFFELPANTSLAFSIPLVLLRAYMSPEDKEKYSNAVPQSFDEIMCGVMLGDGSIRMHGSNALLSIQQTHREIVDNLWNICFSYNLVNTPVGELIRKNWKPVYHFKTFTMPYFTRLFNAWYTNINGRSIKVIPAGIDKLLTPIALAHWIMGDGGFDGHGRGAGRVTLFTNNFTLEEVELLQKLLLDKFGLESALFKVANKDSKRGYAIRIPSRSLSTLQSIVAPHIYPGMFYKIGM
jgi:hypothetical protein